MEKTQKCKYIVVPLQYSVHSSVTFLPLWKKKKTNLRGSGEHFCDLDCDWGETWSVMRKGEEWDLIQSILSC